VPFQLVRAKFIEKIFSKFASVPSAIILPKSLERTRTKTNQYSRFRTNKKMRTPAIVAACLREVAARPGTGENRQRLPDALRAMRGAFESLMTLIILLLGLGVGVLVGLLGIGGGVVLVPALVYLLHMDQHLAQGTSLFILLPPIGLGALREYWKQGQVDVKAGILCAVGMLFGAFAGSLVALPIPSRNLQGMFGCFLMVAAILLWRKGQMESKARAAEAGEERPRG
jgi:hypothetical protein